MKPMKLRPTSECEWVEEHIQRLLIGILRRRDRARLAHHLRRCRACREYYREARRLPGLLASLGAMRPPEGLAWYIQSACAVSSELARVPRHNHLSARLSLAGAAATVLVALMLVAARPPWALSSRRQMVAEPKAGAAVGDVARSPLGHPHVTTGGLSSQHLAVLEPEEALSISAGANAGRPVTISKRLSARGLMHDRVERTSGRRHGFRFTQRAAVADATYRAASHPRRAEQPVLAYAQASGLAVKTSPPVARVALATEEARSVADVPRSPRMARAGLNDAVAVHVATGLVASALIERYLADAIAEQGARLASADIAAHSGAMAVVDDAVLADGDLGGP
ncbi:MAG: hypothetical protein H5T86_06930 [Armatimonadetes bacterium]|nr:hypothetical protein [Armatimonadota bacterium]